MDFNFSAPAVDSGYRSLVQDTATHGRNLLFVAGLNIDISPNPGEEFPLTKFVPWAAYLQRADGTRKILEQDELLEQFGSVSATNPDQISLEKSIETMADKPEVIIRF